MLGIQVVLAVLCIVWFAQSLVFTKNLRHLHHVTALDPPTPLAWPRVSVIIPARNEADSLAAAVRSRLEEDYPDLEIVLVDDRSTDETPAIAQDLARSDARIRYVRVDELPAGWLGKVYALDIGARRATGEWLLFSDADVHVRTGCLRRVVAHCLAHGYDFCALIPEYRTDSFLVDTLWAAFLRILGIVIDTARVRDPRSSASLGSGAFNLARTEAFAGTRGFDWLRLDTTDDMALAAMMKRAGFACEALDGRGCADVRIYRDVRSFFRGTEKNAGSLLGPPFWLLALAFLAWLFLEWSPLLALAVGPAWLRLLGALALGAATAINVAALRTNTGRVFPGLFWFLGSGLFAINLMRATWLAHRRGGIVWRDTFYPRDEILAARRFKL